MGDHLLPANPTGHVNNIRTYTMGVLAVAQMGRCMGEVAYKVSDSTFLWCNALLRKIAMFYNYLYINCKTLSI